MGIEIWKGLPLILGSRFGIIFQTSIRLKFCPTKTSTTRDRSQQNLQQRARIRSSDKASTQTFLAASAMSFAIEVPGEANPLTPQQIFHALQSGSSSQQLSIQTGTQQLQTWETQKGYYTLLQVCCAPMGFWAHIG